MVARSGYCLSKFHGDGPGTASLHQPAWEWEPPLKSSFFSHSIGYSSCSSGSMTRRRHFRILFSAHNGMMKEHPYFHIPAFSRDFYEKFRQEKYKIRIISRETAGAWKLEYFFKNLFIPFCSSSTAAIFLIFALFTLSNPYIRPSKIYSNVS